MIDRRAAYEAAVGMAGFSFFAIIIILLMATPTIIVYNALREPVIKAQPETMRALRDSTWRRRYWLAPPPEEK